MFFALQFCMFIVTLWLFRISSPRRLYLSFFLPLLFPFLFFSSFLFCPLFSVLIFLFFSFSQFASFPQFSLPFPKSAAPVLPHFLLPWHWYCITFNMRIANQQDCWSVEIAFLLHVLIYGCLQTWTWADSKNENVWCPVFQVFCKVIRTRT